MMRGIIGQTILVRVVLALAVSTSVASAQSVRWQKFDIPEPARPWTSRVRFLPRSAPSRMDTDRVFEPRTGGLI